MFQLVYESYNLGSLYSLQPDDQYTILNTRLQLVFFIHLFQTVCNLVLARLFYFIIQTDKKFCVVTIIDSK